MGLQRIDQAELDQYKKNAEGMLGGRPVHKKRRGDISV